MLGTFGVVNLDLDNSKSLPDELEYSPDTYTTGDEATAVIDASNVKFPIHKGNFGGKVIKEILHHNLLKAVPHLKALGPNFWLYTIDSSGNCNYRWDRHQPLPGGWEKEIDVGAWSVVRNASAVKPGLASKLSINYWDGSDYRHSLCVDKKFGDSYSYVIYLMRDAANRIVGRSNLHFTRFDIKIDPNVPFVSPRDCEWQVFTAISKARKTIFSVWLTADRRLRVKFFDESGAYEMPLSSPLPPGVWNGIEIQYQLNSAYGTAACFLNGTRFAMRKGLFTLNENRNNISQLRFGAVKGIKTSGRISMDALRLDDKYIGIKPAAVDQYEVGSDFELNAITIDDFLQAVEAAGVMPMIQVPMYPPADALSRNLISTPQWSADFVEYVNGTADKDFAQKAADLDFTHKTPSDNWANLRAARGRVKPYNVTWWQMSCEPYWVQAWPQDKPQLYADACYRHIKAMKAVDPGIKCAVHATPHPGWTESVLKANRYTLDMICIMHDYAREGDVAYEDQIPRLLGLPSALEQKKQTPWLRRHSEMRREIDLHLHGRPDRNEIPTIMDEHGFMIVYPPGSGDEMGYAMFRLAYRMETIERCGPTAWDGDWLLLTDRKFTYGVIADGTLTPSYWAYRMFGEHYRDMSLAVNVSSPLYTITEEQTEKRYISPYISCYAAKSSEDGSISIMVINRHPQAAIPVNIVLENYGVVAETAEVYTLGGPGIGPMDDNSEESRNIVPQKRSITVGKKFIFLPDPVSISIIVVTPK